MWLVSPSVLCLRTASRFIVVHLRCCRFNCGLTDHIAKADDNFWPRGSDVLAVTCGAGAVVFGSPLGCGRSVEAVKGAIGLACAEGP